MKLGFDFYILIVLYMLFIVFSTTRALLTPRSTSGNGGGGRKRLAALPPPHELLASPQFKLYLYSCKLCSFKCNAIKELTAHKVSIKN